VSANRGGPAGRRAAVVLIAPAGMLIALLAGCGTSDGGAGADLPRPAAVTEPAGTPAPTSVAPAGDTVATTGATTDTAPDAPSPTGADLPADDGGTEPGVAAPPLTEEEIADIERQLDEIDELLTGIELDLEQD
jgi:hypothetical protein